MNNNETKRFISFILTVVMLLGMMPTTSYAIPYADYYLKVGDTMTLQGSYGYIHQWSSSDDSIVAVSNDYRSSNTITAKK
ncbi:MAG: hypothetical protein IKD13_08005, partial [Firmicutes bacterium]|nr:hypothetical protein [Bacillota bacterium]